jgi:hypothetical protein
MANRGAALTLVCLVAGASRTGPRTLTTAGMPQILAHPRRR